MLGIVGGMGPLASAELLHWIYTLQLEGESEQGDPSCALISDPSVPDRTTAILEGRADILLPPLESALERLLDLGAHRLAIACVTIHHVVPQLPDRLRQPLVSLIDLTIDALEQRPGRHLLLCTLGTRRARIFQDHPRWPTVAERIVHLEPDDAEAIHRTLYDLKRNRGKQHAADSLPGLARRYGAEGVVFGCTELHLLQRPLRAGGAEPTIAVVDPLYELAFRARGLAGSASS